MDVGLEQSIDANLNETATEAHTVTNDLSIAPAASTSVAEGIVKHANMTNSNESDVDEAVALSENAGTSGGAVAGTDHAPSPPPNCAICLSRCKNKCFTESCLHQFCFKCLCEWSKIKPECPLCKHTFKSIIHNVRSMDEYDRYHVEPNPSLVERTLTARYLWGEPGLVVPQIRPIIVNEPVPRQDLPVNNQEMPRNLIQSRYEAYRSELINMYRQENEDGSNLIGSLSQLWRRYVYDRKLYALPVTDFITGQFRDWSARFFRCNPAQIHRLMPWINRDVVCLLRNTLFSVSEVMQMITELLPIFSILGPTFRRRLQPYLGERTNHFMHELFNFARSPYDMIGYDRIVQYSAQLGEEITIDYSSMTSSDEDERQQQQRQQQHGENETRSNNRTRSWNVDRRSTSSVIVSNPSAATTHSFSVSLSTDGLVLPPVSVRNSSAQSAAINLSIHSRDGDIIEINDSEFDAEAESEAAANAEVAAINTNTNSSSNSTQSRRNVGAELPITDHIELNSSDQSASDVSSCNSSECEFVLERKPPHLRTPELVSLHSETDSDCVFVDESKPISIKSTNAAAENASFVAAMVDAGGDDLYLGASTSTGTCSSLGKSWRKIVDDMKNRRQRLDMQSCVRQRRRHEGENSSKGSSPSSSSTSSSSSISSSTSSTDSDSNSPHGYASKRKPKSRNIQRENRRNTRGMTGRCCSTSRDKKAMGRHQESATVSVKIIAATRKRRVCRNATKGSEKRKRKSRETKEASSSSSTSSSDTDNSQDKLSLNTLKEKLLNEQQSKLKEEYDATPNPGTSNEMPWLQTVEAPADAAAEPSTLSGTSVMLMLGEYDNTDTPADRRNSCSVTSMSSSSSNSSSSSSSSSRSSSSSATASSSNCSSRDASAGRNSEYQDLFCEATARASPIFATDSSLTLQQDLSANSLVDFTASEINDSSIQNDDVSLHPATSMLNNYVDSVIEDARLPIYSDVSSDEPTQQHTPDPVGEPENPVIDVVGVESFY